MWTPNDDREPVWTPATMTEQREVELRSLAAAAKEQMGAEAFSSMVDEMLLANEAEIRRGSAPGAPAVRRLDALRARRERGFA